MALEVKLGQDLRLRQQLVMTPQLQQAIKILQLSLPELEAIVQSELEQNPMLEPLDQSPAEAASESEMSEPEAAAQADGEPLPPEADGLNGGELRRRLGNRIARGKAGVHRRGRSARRRARDQGTQQSRKTRLARVPRDLFEQLAGKHARRQRRRPSQRARKHAAAPQLARRPPDVAAADVEPARIRSADRRDDHLQSQRRRISRNSRRRAGGAARSCARRSRARARARATVRSARCRRARSSRMPADAVAEPRDGRIAGRANRQQSPRPARKASLRGNRQGAERAGRDGRAGGQDYLAARAQAGPRLRRRRADLRRARRVHPQSRRGLRRHAQSRRGAAPAPGGLLPARAATTWTSRPRRRSICRSGCARRDGW